MEKAQGGVLEWTYKTFMKRNAVYVAFVLAGALAGERVVNYSLDKMWEMNNKGKRYEDISVLGTRTGEDE